MNEGAGVGAGVPDVEADAGVAATSSMSELKPVSLPAPPRLNTAARASSSITVGKSPTQHFGGKRKWAMGRMTNSTEVEAVFRLVDQTLTEGALLEPIIQAILTAAVRFRLAVKVRNKQAEMREHVEKWASLQPNATLLTNLYAELFEDKDKDKRQSRVAEQPQEKSQEERKLDDLRDSVEGFYQDDSEPQGISRDEFNTVLAGLVGAKKRKGTKRKHDQTFDVDAINALSTLSTTPTRQHQRVSMSQSSSETGTDTDDDAFSLNEDSPHGKKGRRAQSSFGVSQVTKNRLPMKKEYAEWLKDRIRSAPGIEKPDEIIEDMKVNFVNPVERELPEDFPSDKKIKIKIQNVRQKARLGTL
mmetsp:Transcript_18898/g.30889  ORF Transcript_18898/g.30889 Transcript_18898/m.30889 type:complete len:359 (+) Transcript_18898:62-1138(+)